MSYGGPGARYRSVGNPGRSWPTWLAWFLGPFLLSGLYWTFFG
jgi:hypothetical protein